MYLPSLPQEGGDAGGTYPGPNTMNDNPAGYQPYFHPGSGDTWAVDRNGMNGANVNMNVNPNPNADMSANVMAAQIDDFEDQEKRLFLEEYRYPGQHPVRTIEPVPPGLPSWFLVSLTYETFSCSSMSLPAAITALRDRSRE